jgi:peptide/nickel transport system ATP-binding protein
MSALLSVDGLCLDTPAGRAVEDVTFAIGAGEVLALIGESGAGKSLTGSALIGLLPRRVRVAGGRIVLAGQQVERLRERPWRRLRGRTISAVFQETGASLDPLQRIGTQLEQTLYAHRKGLRAREARALAEDWINWVNLPHVALQAWPHELSGGMRQRVALALALAPMPRLLIADEPTSALDTVLRVRLATMLRELAREQGTAVLFITHDIGSAAAAADRVAVMYAGRLVEVGGANDVLLHPRHPYSAALLAARPPIDRRLERLPPIGGSMPMPGAIPPGCAFATRCDRATARCAGERPRLNEAGLACWHPLQGADA